MIRFLLYILLSSFPAIAYCTAPFAVPTTLQNRLLAYPGDSTLYQSENLIIKKISPHVFQHISYLKTRDFGKVPCNGMVVINQHKAVVFDTPTDDIGSKELIRYLQEKVRAKIIAVIPTHFHADCVGGLKVFRDQDIPSYANLLTIALLRIKQPAAIRPQNGFKDRLELKIGDKKVIAVYPGKGHTDDNSVGYFPDEHILFGGCLIKEMGATKGNLDDANTQAWPTTVQNVRAWFPDLRIIIPGHGTPAGTELLEYTIQLFE